MDYQKFHTSPLAANKYSTRHGADESSGTKSLAAAHKTRKQYRAAAVEDMAHKAVQLETEEFLDEFFALPAGKSEEGCPKVDQSLFKDLKEAEGMSEAQVSEAFIKALNTVVDLTPDLRLAESPHRPDQGKTTPDTKVDAGFFRPKFMPTDGRPHWADQVVPVEFKSQDTKNDPYDDRPGQVLDTDTITRKDVRGQLIDYAEEVFRYQHRTELYMLLILGRRFRFLRWDRSGTVVTPATDYYENSQLLCQMLWRMAQLNDEQLGLDPTAKRIRPDMPDFAKMDTAAIPQSSDVDHTERTLPGDAVIPDHIVFRYVRKGFADSLGPEWPRYRLEIPQGDSVRSFLVGKPTFRANGMAGRGTRGYIALDCETGHFVWLKDAWRAFYELVHMEGNVLIDLNKKGVPNVPTVVCHGDILKQVTQTPRCWEIANDPDRKAKASSATTRRTTASSITPTHPASSRTLAESQPTSSNRRKRTRSEVDDSEPTPPKGAPREDCPLRRHKHYRLAVKEVCMPLVKFQSGRQLLEIIYTCVRAHQAAMVNAKIVHRDVSGGNILILPTVVRDSDTKTAEIKWWGLLVDWELSKPVHDNSGPPRARQPERSGTWQYMSVATLNEHTKAVETSDELESFFHVVLYHSVRYLSSNCTDAASFIDSFFDSYTLDSGKYICGDKKAAVMLTGKLYADNRGKTLLFKSPMDAFLRQLLNLFNAHYEEANLRAENAEEATAPPPITAPPQRRSTILKHFNAQNPPVEPEAPPTNESAPEEKRRALARQLQRHDCMLTALVTAIDEGQWPQGDRVKGDNVSSKYTPPVPVGPPKGSASNKKARTDGSSSPDSSPAILTSHQSAPLP